MIAARIRTTCQKAGWLFLIVSFCLVPFGASADDPNPKTILIFAEINESETGDHDFPPGQSNFSLAFFATLRDILVDEGFEPVFIRASADEHYPDFFEPLENYQDLPNFWKRVISISPTSYGEADYVTLTPFAGYQHPDLPMGIFWFSLLPKITADRFASLGDVAELSAAVALYTNHHCDAALPLFRKANANQSLLEEGLLVDPGARFYQANCEYDEGLIEDAVTSYQAVVDYVNEDSSFESRTISEHAAINLAWIYAQQGQLDQGVALLDSYTSTNYDTYTSFDIERFLKRADVYLALGADDSAIAEITRLIGIATGANAETVDSEAGERFPANIMAQIYTERGQRYWQIERPVQALADFNQAIQIDSQYPKVYYWRGVLRYERGLASQASADFGQFLTLAPDYDEYYEEDLAPYIEQATNYLAQITATSPSPTATTTSQPQP